MSAPAKGQFPRSGSGRRTRRGRSWHSPDGRYNRVRNNDAIFRQFQEGNSMTRPLEGIRVIDFGRYIAGPYCGALLADFGAEVIRVERVEGGEDRWITPVTSDGVG